ncbi:hypothetical protein KKG19_04750 [Patescibacteria group bacterium]|nr:hypothetical protein [Patescibacteria group bacterium]MBU1901295.1 hypothetical protein [Patescibacteria group bacterium]
MITDFPNAKKQIKRILDEILRAKVKQNAPMLSMVNKRMMHEGDRLGIIDENGKHTVSPMKLVESEFFISNEEAKNIKAEDIISKVTSAGEDMAGKIERDLFQTLDKSIKESGNTIPGNPELSPEAILTALEMMPIDFEDDDRLKPIKPSLVAAPAAVEKLMQIEASSTEEEKEEYRKKEEEIFDKKYAEYIKDIESRKIID